MKKFLCGVCAFLLIVAMLPVSAACAETETICFEDGSYATIHISFTNSRASGSITGKKTFNYYNSNNVRQWKAVLTGSFTYTGSSATCTSSSMDVTIYDSAWYIVSKSSGKSGSTARGNATVGEKLLGVTVSSVPVSLTLSCDANGNLS